MACHIHGIGGGSSAGPAQNETVDFDLLPIIIEDALEVSAPSRAARRKFSRPTPCEAGGSQTDSRRSRSPAGSMIVKISDDLEMILPTTQQVRGSTARARFLHNPRFETTLSAVYLEPFRGDIARNCGTCRQMFRMRELRLGYMQEDLLRPTWIHVGCIWRARLQAVGQRIAYHPTISEATLGDALGELGRTRRSRTSLQRLVPWSYLPASRWPSQQVTAVATESVMEQPLNLESESALAAVLAALPCSQLTGSMEACAICHQAMAAGEMVCTLPCTHSYHVGCIDAWLRIRTTCPLDNQEIQQMLMPRSEDVEQDFA